MVIASRVLPVLIVLIGEGYPTLSNRDNVTNNYLRLLLVLWLVFCFLPLLALASFQWFLVVEACPSEWENVTRVVFSFKTLLSFATISIVLDYLALDVKVIRIVKLRKKYQAKLNAAKASGDTVEAAKPPPTFSQLLSFVLLTEDRSEPFEELLSYSVNSVVFILNFTVSFFYPQCSGVTLFYFFVKFYLDKYQLVYLFKSTSRSDGTLLRYIFALLSMFCALSIMLITYILNLYDIAAVEGSFNVFQDSQYKNSGISFPIVSILSGSILLIIAGSSVLPFIPSWVPTSVKNVRYAQVVANYLAGEKAKRRLSDAGDRVASLSSEFTNSSVATTNFEDDFGKYASPYLISHLTTTAYSRPMRSVRVVCCVVDY